MPDKPLLIFPSPTLVSRAKKSAGATPFHFPSTARQTRRLTPKFRNIERAFEAQRAQLLGKPEGAIPEQVLVLETIGTVDDFFVAVRYIPGMEWLGEWDEEDIPPDRDFFYEDNRDKKLNGRLYLVMTNRTAINEMLAMWRLYRADTSVKLPRGRAKWKKMFQLLKDIRPWGVQDRLIDTGILDDWTDRVENGQDRIRFETELWFKENEESRNQSENYFATLLNANGGRLIKKAIIPDIRYHGILADLPITAIQTILEHQNARLIHCEQVMFFRAVGQVAVKVPEDEPLTGQEPPATAITPEGEPVVAMFDGLPLENHAWLEGRLVVDDPDNWGAEYPPHERCHGTAMASLIIHDELDVGGGALNKPLYIRPILKPDIRDWATTRKETMPEDELQVDLIHRTVKRMYESVGGHTATAPSVKIVNLSVCDLSRPFISFLSPWARLLDWLSWKYNILFIISAGNQVDEIELNVPRESFSDLSDEQLEEEVIKSIASNFMNRRILSPSESINSLTVCASHIDSAPENGLGTLIDPFNTSSLPSPINSLGLGFRRSIKPDVLYKGGKQLYMEKPGTTHSNAILQPSQSSSPPGLKTAAPGRSPRDLSSTRYYCGTSNATALTTRIAAQLHDIVDALRQEESGELINEQYIAVLIKALIVHGSHWGETYNSLKEILRPISQPRKIKENINRFLGYGHLDSSRIFACTDQRATLIGCNTIGGEEAHLYTVPLPPSLSGPKVWRKLTITLAWFTPINSAHRAYRRASLWFDPPKDELVIDRQESDWLTVKRGTVQHEILEGSKASVFVEDETLNIQVNCRADAGTLSENVPYAIVATLEVAEELDIPIYNEILTRIRPQVSITPSE